MREVVMTDWLHFAAVHMAENSIPFYNTHPRLLHAHRIAHYNPSFTVSYVDESCSLRSVSLI